MVELGIAFDEVVHVFRAPSNRLAFRAFSPGGTVPCLEHDGDVIWDSLAIIEYLAERHPGVWPENPRARAWARAAVAEMHSGFAALRNRCPMNCGIRVRLDRVPGDLAADLERLEELWRDGLVRFAGPFLGGPAFTAVDAFFAPVAFRVQTYGPLVDANSQAYVQRLVALAGMQTWYEQALLEPWREPVHEAEATAAGALLADFRRYED